jgi:DNA-dependent protein kinase catalytic subunit
LIWIQKLKLIRIRIRNPALQVVGSNGRTYPFIVKLGEDLRQDQRIQQLFHICNSQLGAGDLNARQMSSAHSRIETYAVVPLTKRLGLIEFVPNTLPLRDFIHLIPQAQHQAEQATRSYISGMHALTKQHSKLGVVSWKDFQYAPLVADEAIVGNYNKAADLIERFNLRSALVSISSGAEGFYFLRKSLITSYAVLSAVQWLLGMEIIFPLCFFKQIDSATYLNFSYFSYFSYLNVCQWSGLL